MGNIIRKAKKFMRDSMTESEKENAKRVKAIVVRHENGYTGIKQDGIYSVYKDGKELMSVKRDYTEDEMRKHLSTMPNLTAIVEAVSD